MNRSIMLGRTAYRLKGGLDVLWRGLTMLPGFPVSFPGPKTVQLQTVEGCNGLCPMCPNTVRSSHPGKTIREELYLSILEQLAAMGSLGTLLPMLHNEPLLDPHLCRRVRQAKSILGKAVAVRLVTNGVLLTEELAAELAESGLEDIQISLDAVKPETYAAIRPGLDMHKALDAVDMCLRVGLPVGVRFVRQKANRDEEQEFVRSWRSRGVGVLASRVTNRMGDLKTFDSLHVRSEPNRFERTWDLLAPILPSCVAPFLRMTILFDGRAVICCHDWTSRKVLGDLSREDLARVWRGEQASACRTALWTGTKEGIPVCRDCSVRHPFSER